MIPPEVEYLTPSQHLAKYFTIGNGVALFYHGPLSNWWFSPYRVEENWFSPHVGRTIRFNCTEQHMMAYKAIVNHDWDMYEKILACDGPFDGTQADFNKYPRKQKALGRKVRNPHTGSFDAKMWDNINVDLVTQANLMKFDQHPNLLEVLDLTKGLVLAEASPIDKIWGIGLSRDNPKSLDQQNWKGRNKLGQVLMRVRKYMCGE